MSLPNKEEIRKKYEIKEKDFDVQELAEIPDPKKLLQEGAKIEKRGFWGDFEVWTKTTIIGGVLMAVLFIAGVVIPGVETIYKYGNIIYTNHNQIVDYADHFAQYAKDQAKGFLVHTPKPPTEEDKQHQDMAIFPTGSLVYPVSGDWRPS
jgi:ribosomal protein S15P/S13E